MESQEYIEKSSELSKSCINHSVSQLPVSQKETHMSGNFKLNQETNKWPDQEQYIIGYDDYGRHERKVIDLDFSVSRYPDVIKDDRFNNPVLFRHNKKVISPVESWQKKRSHSPAMLRIKKRDPIALQAQGQKDIIAQFYPGLVGGPEVH
ncbi:unnamed protein product [Rotaria magnacalcarata]|nr:unnamed protein product [Rotaria magnacalcarata]